MLTESRVAMQGALATLLTAEPRFDQSHDIAATRAALARVDRDIELYDGRIAAFRAQLPSVEAQAAAEANATTLRTAAGSALAEFPSRWSGFLAALDAAETAARELARVRSAAEMTIASLKAVVSDNGLVVAVPPPPSPDASQTELARHQVMLLMNIAEGVGPDPTVEQYLGMLRPKVAAALG